MTMYVLPPFLMHPSVLLLPGGALALLLLLSLPSLLSGGVAKDVATAAYSYIAQSLGIVLMTIGALPSAYAVFAQQPLASGAYVGLLLTFSLGGLLYLRHDTKLSKMPSAAKQGPGVLFFYMWKVVGLVIALFAGLSALLSLSTIGLQEAGDWWINQMVLLLYGLIVSWFTIGSYTTSVKAAPIMKASPAPAKKLIAGKPLKLAKR